MKRIQKILSLVLALMLVLSATVAIIPASAEEAVTESAAENLIVNGDFESSAEGWYWSMGTTTEYVYEGTSALIMNDGTKNYQPVFQCVPVTPYTDYTYSFWYYAPVGGDWSSAWYVNGAPDNVDKANPVGYFKTVADDVNGETLAKDAFSTCEEGQWIQATVTVNSGAYEVFVLSFYTNAENNVQLYVDNASLTVSANADNGNAIKNGGFESQRENWGAEYYGLGDINADRIVSDNVNSGTYSATVPSGYNHFIYTKFDCIANTDYELEFYTINANGVKLAISPTLDQNNVSMFRTNNVPEGIIYNKGITNTENWSQNKVRFNSGDNTTIYIAFYNPYEGEGTIRIDDVSVTIDNEADNLFKNGDMEDGTTGWYWVAGTSTENYHSGEQSLQITKSNYNRTFRCIDVTPNTNYEYSFWYYAPAGGSWWGEGWHVNGAPANVDKANPTAYFFNGASVSKLAGGSYSKCDTGVWKKVIVTFNSGSHEVVVLEFTNHEGKEIYIDDVKLRVDPYADSIIKNGGFEDGSYKWTGIGTAISVVSNAVVTHGENALRVAGGYYSKVRNLFECEPNTDYILSFKLRAPKVNWATKYGIVVGDGQTLDADEDGVIASAGLSTTSGWTDVKLEFNSGENSQLYVSFQGYDPCEYYIDNVSVKVSPYNGQIVKNGGFEYDTDKWSTGGGEISTDEYYEGKASLKLSTTQFNKASQQFAVKANTDYVVSYWYKGNAYSRWGVGTTTGVEPEQRIAGDDIHGTDGEWKRAYVFFNSGDNTSLYFSVMSGSNDIEIYIDNVSVAAVEAGDANGDGYKDATDLTVLKKVLLGVEVTHSTTGCKVRGEDAIDIRDLIRLKKEIVNTAE